MGIFTILTLQSCTCNPKYNQLQNQYAKVQAQKQAEQDTYRRELHEKDEQIQKLLRQIKILESHIKEIKAE